MKRQIVESEKIFASHISDKGLAFQNKNSQNSAIRKQTTQFFKWVKDLNK